MKEFIKKHRVDLIVISSLVLVSLLVLLVVTLTRQGGERVEVSLDGEVVGSYSLLVDGVYTINGGTNTLTISGGVAYMSYSSCPDHVCENTGRVRYVGEMIVCLPNRVTVTVVGQGGGAVDFVS